MTSQEWPPRLVYCADCTRYATPDVRRGVACYPVGWRVSPDGACWLGGCARAFLVDADPAHAAEVDADLDEQLGRVQAARAALRALRGW